VSALPCVRSLQLTVTNREGDVLLHDEGGTGRSEQVSASALRLTSC
jgi:hypothetical protein